MALLFSEKLPSPVGLLPHHLLPHFPSLVGLTVSALDHCNNLLHSSLSSLSYLNLFFSILSQNRLMMKMSLSLLNTLDSITDDRQSSGSLAWHTWSRQPSQSFPFLYLHLLPTSTASATADMQRTARDALQMPLLRLFWASSLNLVRRSLFLHIFSPKHMPSLSQAELISPPWDSLYPSLVHQMGLLKKTYLASFLWELNELIHVKHNKAYSRP